MGVVQNFHNWWKSDYSTKLIQKHQEGRKIKKVFRLGFFVILLQTNNHFRIALVAERIIYYIP